MGWENTGFCCYLQGKKGCWFEMEVGGVGIICTGQLALGFGAVVASVVKLMVFWTNLGAAICLGGFESLFGCAWQGRVVSCGD